MTDCRTCKHYQCEDISENGLYIIRVVCEKDCKKMMMSSYDCKKYEPNYDDNK